MLLVSDPEHMLDAPALDSGVGRETIESTLREVVETLAALDRTPCSPGERAAAEWLAGRLEDVDGVRAVALEDEPSWGTFPPTATGLGLLGMCAAAAVLRGRRRRGALGAAVTFAGIVDEAQNGPRILRRVVRRRRSTVNLVASIEGKGIPDEASGPLATRVEDGDIADEASAGLATRPRTGTLVVLAHHDAPQSGVIFDQTLQRRIHERAPQLLERGKTPPPQWWVGLAGPLATLCGALSGRRRLACAGLAVGVLGTALVADIWRNATVPGANDNLSGVAVLVALAELLSAAPIQRLRVLLVSCGAEETLQDGIRAFMARHRHELDPRRTWFVNLDTVGSPHLIMLEGEGPVWMEDYTGPWLRDLLADSAERVGIALQRGFRARSSTDSVIPSRAGYPIATLLSMTDWRSPANYHLPSDVPANLDYGSVADATRLVYGLAGALAGRLAVDDRDGHSRDD
jgi:Peptidase family M28